jgi:hypothetical protein
MIAPAISEFATDLEGLTKVGRLDVDDNPNTVARHCGRLAPLLLFFSNHIVDYIFGEVPKTTIAEKLNALVRTMSVSAEHKNADAGGGPNMDQPATYEIRMRGQPDAKCKCWLDDGAMTNQSEDDGSMITTLTVVTANQRQLHGLLVRMRDECLPILSVIRIRKGGNTDAR